MEIRFEYCVKLDTLIVLKFVNCLKVLKTKTRNDPPLLVSFHSTVLFADDTDEFSVHNVRLPAFDNDAMNLLLGDDENSKDVDTGDKTSSNDRERSTLLDSIRKYSLALEKFTSDGEKLLNKCSTVLHQHGFCDGFLYE